MSKSDGEEEEEEWTDSDEDDWTLEDKQRYAYQIESSDGFDVELPVRKANFFSVIGPMNIADESVVNFKAIAEASVKAYNEFEKRETGELQFEKVLKCMGQVSAFMNYFMTFEAKDLSNGEVKTYQAVIFEDIQGKMDVLSFRRKPSDEEVASNLPKEWVWHTEI